MEIRGKNHTFGKRTDRTNRTKKTKKRIREDVITSDEEIAEIIIESTWSTKHTNWPLNKGKFMLPKLKNK